MCLSHLAWLEKNAIHPSLVDLFQYYALLGIAHSSPSTCASSIAVLTRLFQDSHEMAASLMGEFVIILKTFSIFNSLFLLHLYFLCVSGELQTRASNPHWEIRCQILIACAIVLKNAPRDSSHFTAAFSICLELFQKDSPLNQRLVGKSIYL